MCLKLSGYVQELSTAFTKSVSHLACLLSGGAVWVLARCY